MATGNFRSTKDEVLEHVAKVTQRLDGKDRLATLRRRLDIKLSISRNSA